MALNVKATKNGSGVNDPKTFKWERLWSCCNCGQHAAMSVDSTLACPGCGAYRCCNCIVEQVKRKTDGSHSPWRRFPNPAPAPQAIGSNPSQSSYTANIPSRAPIPQDIETSKSSTVQSNNAEIPNPAPVPPKIQSSLVQSHNTDDLKTKRSVTTPEESIAQAMGMSDDTIHSSNKGNQLPDDASQKPKSRWKKPRTDSYEATQSFACHYNKRYPFTYDPRACKKYGTCLVPSVPVHGLRRLKEHFLKVHGPLYCDRCSKLFNKESELFKHSRDTKSCRDSTGPLLYLEDGISSTQWGAIFDLLKEKGGLKGAEKERQEISKWNTIWDVLSPGVQRPSSPWVELPSRSAPFLGGIESFVSIFKQITMWKVQQGILVQDDNTERIYEKTLRESYQVCLDQIPNPIGDDRLDTKPVSGFDWKEHTMFDKVVPSFSANSCGKSQDPPKHQMHPTEAALVENRSETHGQNSQLVQRLSDARPLFAVETFSLSAIPTTSALEDAHNWPFNSGFDPNATLLSPSHGDDYQPDFPSDEPPEDFDEFDLCMPADLHKSSVAESYFTPTAGENGNLRPSSPVWSSYLHLLMIGKSGEYYFSPEDHKISVAELDELLDTKRTSHVEQQDLC